MTFTLKDFYTFLGRYRRLKYVVHFAALSVVSSVIASFIQNPVLGHSLNAVYLLLVMVPIVKRFHDLGKSSWWLLTLLIPLVNVYFGLCLLFKKGQAGPNQYGSDPLDPSSNPQLSSSKGVQYHQAS